MTFSGGTWATHPLDRLSLQLSKAGLTRFIRRTPGRLIAFLLVGGGFWMGAYHGVSRVLFHFSNVELIGPILIVKFLYMIFLTFFTMLLFSNVVVAISTFYLSDELGLLLSSPVDTIHIIRHKFQSTMIQSSWMILLIGGPVFLAYARVYDSPWWVTMISLTILLPFFLSTTCLAVMLVAPLMRLIPAQRTRQLIAFLGAGFACGLTVLFRWLRPERLMNPSDARTTLEFLADLNAPTSVYLPSTWAVKSLLALFQGRWPAVWLPVGVLWLESLALLALAAWIMHRGYYRGWCHAQESSVALPGPAARRPAPTFLRIHRWTHPIALLFYKDSRVFRRDPTQWPQMLMLASITAVYLLNMYHLPLHRFSQNEYLTTFRSLVFFLNMGFVAFIITAVAARFSFPAVSLEGKSVWLLRCAPLTGRQILWSKFLMYAVPLWTLSLLLVGLSSWFLRVDAFMTVLSLVTCSLLTMGIVSLSIGLGALFPRYDTPNAAEIPTGWGGLVFMLTSISYIALTLMIEAGPVHAYYVGRLAVGGPTDFPAFIWEGSAVLLLTLLVWTLPMHWGAKKLEGEFQP